MRPLALAFVAVLVTACNPFESQDITAADLDAATVTVEFFPGASAVDVAGAVAFPTFQGRQNLCPAVPGFAATVDGHAIGAQGGEAGTVPVGGSLGISHGEDGCVPTMFGDWAQGESGSAPVPPDERVSTIALHTGVRDVTVKVAALNAARTMTVRSAAAGKARVGEHVSVVVSVPTDRLTYFDASWNHGDGGNLNDSDLRVEGAEAHFTVPDDWPAGAGTLEVTYATSPEVPACDGVAHCELTWRGSVKIPLEVVP